MKGLKNVLLKMLGTSGAHPFHSTALNTERSIIIIPAIQSCNMPRIQKNYKSVELELMLVICKGKVKCF